MPDEYGCFDKESLSELNKEWQTHGNIIFAYSPNKIDAYVIEMNKSAKKLGKMPFGGDPEGRVWVSVYSRGANHFSLTRDTSEGYLREKLGVDPTCAGALSDIFKALGS